MQLGFDRAIELCPKNTRDVRSLNFHVLLLNTFHTVLEGQQMYLPQTVLS